MKQYLDIMFNTIEYGRWKSNRTGVRTLTLPNQHFSHNMAQGFPLLTTKKMPLKTIAVELEGFIKGVVSKTWYQQRKCYIWDSWANPYVVQQRMNTIEPNNQTSQLRQSIQKDVDDLGPVYGFQWRRFGEACDENDNGILHGADQLKQIVETLHNNPNDRRMVCSAWNPNQLDRMALPACHFVWVLTHVDGVLNLHWTQRSCDLFLGVPFNIASYALLLLLLCKEANMQPGNLSGMLCDCHVYENHLEQCKLQLSRVPKDLPTVEILNEVDDNFSIFDWTHDNIALNNYRCENRIVASVAV